MMLFDSYNQLVRQFRDKALVVVLLLQMGTQELRN